MEVGHRVRRFPPSPQLGVQDPNPHLLLKLPSLCSAWYLGSFSPWKIFVRDIFSAPASQWPPLSSPSTGWWSTSATMASHYIQVCQDGWHQHENSPPPHVSWGKKNFSSTKQYQHIFSSPVNLAGDIFLNFVLSAAVEVKALFNENQQHGNC